MQKMDSSESSASEDDSQSSDSSTESSDHGTVGARKRKRKVKISNYLQGKCRKVYKLSDDLETSLQESPNQVGVCSNCEPSLARFAED